jgi:GNAT superfamily N-acetyltransferase
MTSIHSVSHPTGALTLERDTSFRTKTAVYRGINPKIKLLWVAIKEQKATIWGFEIEKKFQAQGHGKQIITDLEDLLTELGATEIHGETLDDAKGFWLKQGYTFLAKSSEDPELTSFVKRINQPLKKAA